MNMDIKVDVRYKNLKLQECRKKAGMSQSQLGAAAGISVRVLQQYEQGARDIDGARLSTLLKFCLALKCGLSDIVSDEATLELIKGYGKRGYDPAYQSDYKYRIDRYGGAPVLVIIDFDLGGISVTNNMEAILAKIGRDEGLDLSAMAIIYRDSEGYYDGVKMDGSGGITFYPVAAGGPVTDEREAIGAARGVVG
jgi:transcriptional regulator with XRE-family HTH domain